MLSPPGRHFEIPAAREGLENEKFVRQFYFFIIHRSTNPLFNFVLRQPVDIFHAPKFTVEVLTPFVRVREGELLRVRLTNHSRDGVRDSIYVTDSLVSSEKKQFRMNSKGLVWYDTLALRWNTVLKDSTYLFAVKIAGDEVGYFAARKIDVQPATPVSLAVIPSRADSPLLETLLRVDARATVLRPDSLSELSRFRCVVMDAGALTTHPDISLHKDLLKDFVENGGHLIVLVQHAETWNRAPLWDGMRLEPSFSLDAESNIIMSNSSRLFSIPHRISADDWKGWIFNRGFNKLTLTSNAIAETPLKGKIGTGEHPLVISERVKAGRRTYVDLNLDHQWLNIHEGAFRFFVNLLFYDYSQEKTQ